MKTYLEQIDELLKRKVGPESSKSYEDKIRSGFFDKYMSGQGLSIGSKGDQPDKDTVLSILPTGIDVGLDFPKYDGIHLPFADNSQDWIYSSHVYEHITDRITTIKEWYRVLKVEGYLIIIVPHKYLYERRNSKPSRWNGDHKEFFTISNLVKEIEEALEPNSYRIRVAEDSDKGYDYSVPLTQHPGPGQLEITLVLQKIQKPSWDLE